jgi:hypothetical protein
MDTLYKHTFKRIENILYSQDFQQLCTMSWNVSLELYRMMISSLLILFVPQKCGHHICSLAENIQSPTHKYYIALVINYITMASLLIMYICEIRREEKLIKVLEVNNTISTDNESVGKRLEVLDLKKRERLFLIDRYYQYTSSFAIVIYILNAILSGIVIQDYSLGNQTIMVYLTNILFMVNKFSNVYIIINTDKNIFFSAYLNTKVQFNDIDPREIVKIKRRKSIEHNAREIERTHGFCLLEKHPFRLLEGGGFIVEISSSDSDNELSEKNKIVEL